MDDDIPMIVVPADDETVAIVEDALADPDDYLSERHRTLDPNTRLATAIVFALWNHSWGMDLTTAEPTSPEGKKS